jgi:hypothetical protein
MKKLWKTAATLVALSLASTSFAEVLKPEVKADAVKIIAVSVKSSSGGIGPIGKISVTAQFSNGCTAPKSNELVEVRRWNHEENTLDITLGKLRSRRMCTADYSPVNIKIDLGEFTSPLDGPLPEVTVNGVAQ